MTRVVISRAVINGQPARLFVDTGANCMAVFKPEAGRLSLGKGEMSDPATVVIGGQTNTGPIPIVWGPAGEADGLVGWPEIRNNPILVFDADRREIRRADKLPPETQGWLKLRIIPNRWLMLEAPLDNGGTGTIYVDTGAPAAVQVPPDEWKTWRQAHPQAALTTRRATVQSFGAFNFKVAWADEYRLGPLRLTDLAVQNTGAGEADFLQRNAPGSKMVWALGMYALARMDMILDTRAGFAYVHPRSPPGPPYPGVIRTGYTNDLNHEVPSPANWRVARNVLFSGDDLFVVSGNWKWRQRDFAGAKADYEQALKLNPDNADARSGRGEAREIEGDFAGAVSDYDRCIELSPDTSDYERLYRQTILWRLGQEPADTANGVAGCKTEWTRIVGRFLTGSLNEQSLAEEADKPHGNLPEETVSDQRAMAIYYMGMARLAKGDRAGARLDFEKCKKVIDAGDDEYLFACAELERLAKTADKGGDFKN